MILFKCRKVKLSTIFILTFLLYVTYAHATIPKNFNFNQIPIEKDTKKYENKEYDTSDKYLNAFYEGKCSSVWVWLHISYRDKTGIVKAFKGMFREGEHVIIKKPASFYVEALDYVIANTPGSENFRLRALFKTIAVMECDFDEKVDKAVTARRWMGSYYPIFEEYQKLKRNQQ